MIDEGMLTLADLRDYVAQFQGPTDEATLFMQPPWKGHTRGMHSRKRRIRKKVHAKIRGSVWGDLWLQFHGEGWWR